MPSLKAQQLIKNIENKKDRISMLSDPSMGAAKNKITQEINTYLEELRGKLDKASSDGTANEEKEERIMRSLWVLDKTLTSLNLLNSCLSTMYSASEFFMRDSALYPRELSGKKSDVDVIGKLGVNVINTAKQFNNLLEDESRSLPSKLWIMLKAYSNAVISGIKGVVEGVKEGFDEGKGLMDTASNMFQKSITRGWEKFFEGWGNSYEKYLKEEPPKQSAQQDTGFNPTTDVELDDRSPNLNL
ncbi:hypothetical protein [Legionella hackeliae]|uniref:Uncharacterized protein n=1 Tax=Legionella hackeliae TaxID=449 RepID=A0A0A8UTF4_LEGHA|nr:hypothetical protein [Legionella hackeliae]KTD14172.1 hypothetical protein Lhac_0484 [Legionella hackeliae]CEK10382.1 protein of unknown function [Legionella hackeliae]STX47116.1 Uncharacterised protein [Legionella hackeliae]